MNQLNFELPVKNTEAGRRQPKLIPGLLILILFGVGADILISINPEGIKIPVDDRAALDAEQLKKTALKLEKSGLNHSAAGAWKDYIESAGLDDKEAALIWYRVGKLYQENDDCEKALDGYYRSESIYAHESIAPEIAMRIQECLESLGKISAVRHELADRVTLQAEDGATASGDLVVAEIGTRKITAAEMDQRMEDTIERQMRMMAPSLPDEERQKQKASLLKEFSTPDNRRMFLNQFIAEEILYQKAREEKLANERHVRDLLDDQKRSLLAAMVLEKEYADQIKITSSDLETYFKAHKEAFKKEGKEQTFEDVKNDIYKTLRSQKEQDIRQHLLNRLKEQFDVVIHQSAFSALPPSPAETQTRNTPTGNNQ